eukprot:scaffold3906_cov120-Isochrysis_galbana.AAC.10
MPACSCMKEGGLGFSGIGTRAVSSPVIGLNPLFVLRCKLSARRAERYLSASSEYLRQSPSRPSPYLRVTGSYGIDVLLLRQKAPSCRICNWSAASSSYSASMDFHRCSSVAARPRRLL